MRRGKGSILESTAEGRGNDRIKRPSDTHSIASALNDAPFSYHRSTEWEKMKTLAKEAYGELEWEDSGYGEYGQFSFVKPNTENKG